MATALKVEKRTLAAQPGPQREFLQSTADIVIFGGAAGGGKTHALLMEPLLYQKVRGFGAVIFRRTTKQVRGEGGLWDSSSLIYPHVGGKAREADLEWRFPPVNVRFSFAHMEHESNRFDWDSTQIPMIGFDQLESFTAAQFWHMLGRNRSMCGVKPYIRATCNPDPDSFIVQLIDWYIAEDGYPDPDRCRRKRWFVRVGDDLLWGDGVEEVGRRAEQDYGLDPREFRPLSFRFIPALPDDNPALMEADPGYLAKLNALPRVERERLRRGNWKIRPASGDYFQRQWCEFVDAPPERVRRRVRSWDLASTRPSSENPNPDWTVGVLMSRTEDDRVVLEGAVRRRDSPGRIEELVLRTAEHDGRGVEIHLSQDPGQAGKSQVEDLARKLSAYRVSWTRETGPKETRFGPFSSKAEHGGVKIVRGPWNDRYLVELENFPPASKSGHDDDADATASAYNWLFQKVKRGGAWGRKAA